MSHESNTRNNSLFLYGMILSMFCWGISWASGKVLTVYAGTFTISFFRFGITFASLLVLLLIFREKMTIDRKGLKDLLPASIGIAAYTYFFFKGLLLGKAGAGGVLVTTLNPIVSYSIMLLFSWRRPTRNETLGILFGMVAGAILLKVWDNWQNVFNAGNTFFLLASFTWAILSLFTAKSSRYGSPVAFSLWMYAICSVIMFFVANSFESIELHKEADIYFWTNLIFTSTITTAMATTFYFVATARLGASKASSFIFLVPFSAAMGSWIFLNEVPQIHTIAGGLIGVGAVYILNRKQQ